MEERIAVAALALALEALLLLNPMLLPIRKARPTPRLLPAKLSQLQKLPPVGLLFFPLEGFLPNRKGGVIVIIEN